MPEFFLGSLDYFLEQYHEFRETMCSPKAIANKEEVMNKWVDLIRVASKTTEDEELVSSALQSTEVELEIRMKLSEFLKIEAVLERFSNVKYR